ncbi:cysteine hydrolase [Vibrio sp.]|nr:cysteine hydrolase [Vibrio sp.]
MNTQAILIIDFQNDYLPEGRFPLWNTLEVLRNTNELICAAIEKGIPICLVQHISLAPAGEAKFFEKDSFGAEISEDILRLCRNAKIIEKQYADSFYKTQLEEYLSQLGTKELLVCGMMTQNCVTHTVLSKSAEKYRVSIVADCCTTTDPMIHHLAINAISNRVPILSVSNALKA